MSKIRRGGRLIYAGAGSSGLIAKLDAHELPATFGIPHHQALALIAGGSGTFEKIDNRMEDSAPQAVADLAAVKAGAAPPESRALTLNTARGPVELRDLRGFVHCHTNYSDGFVTVAEWANACREGGYQWLGVTDHSQAAAYSGGLKADDIARQHAEIDQVNRALDDFRVLKGVEADILADGAIDYGSDVLDRFDFVIGSIHARFGMTESEMTERVLRAMDDPHLTILGHPTGRLLLFRDPYPLDVERVLARAAERGAGAARGARGRPLRRRTARRGRSGFLAGVAGRDDTAHRTCGRGHPRSARGVERGAARTAGGAPDRDERMKA